MKKTAESIAGRVDLERNLPEFANNMAQLYNSFSSVKLSMNYYIFNQMIADMENNGEITELFRHLKTVIKPILNPHGEMSYEMSYDDVLSEIGEIRSEVQKRTSRLMAYVDIFNIYEHVFNRMEYRYKKPEEIPGRIAGMSDEDVTRKAMRYILSDNDNVLINGKIAEIVRELPVRMTKQRFFELLAEGIRVYRNGTVGELNDYLYVLESTALSMDVSGKAESEREIYFEDLERIEREMKNISFADITKEQFEKYSGLLREAVELIDEKVSAYTLFAGIVNDVLVVALSDRYILSFSNERKMLAKVIEMTDESFTAAKPYENGTEIERLFEDFEGVQEELYEKYSSYEYVIDIAVNDLADVVDGMNLRHIYECLGKLSILVSSNLFVDFDAKKDNTKLDDGMLYGIIAGVTDRYKTFFDAHEKCVNRTVMAVTLSMLPVFFNNISEIQDYIYNSLVQCGNEYEKLACRELLITICDGGERREDAGNE